MNAPIDTLAFTQRFENAGFASEQARALAAAIALAQEAGRDDLVTRSYLDMRLAESRTETIQALADFRLEMTQALAATRQELTQAMVATRQDLTQAMAATRQELMQALADQNLSLTKAIAETGRDLSGRLWSTVTIIAGVSTAVSATVGAGVALLLKAGGL